MEIDLSSFNKMFYSITLSKINMKENGLKLIAWIFYWQQQGKL